MKVIYPPSFCLKANVRPRSNGQPIQARQISANIKDRVIRHWKNLPAELPMKKLSTHQKRHWPILHYDKSNLNAPKHMYTNYFNYFL